MGRRDIYEQKTWDLLQPVLKELELVPVDVEFVKEGPDYYLRIYVDREGGVTIDDCVDVSRRIDPMLDEADFIEEAYTLEVSSPGLGRPLRRPRDFEYARGREVELRFYKAPGGRKGKEFRGLLQEADKDKVTVLIRGEDVPSVFRKAELSLIRLAYDPEED